MSRETSRWQILSHRNVLQHRHCPIVYATLTLTLDECMKLCLDSESSSNNPDMGPDYIAKCRYLKIHEYGNIYIGLPSWNWFALDEERLDMTHKANLVEWYFRMTNQPANADAIVAGVLDRIGNYRLTAFDVAGACEKDPYRFKLNEDGNYSLCLWEDAPKYKEAIEEILKSGESDIEHIVNQLSDNSSGNTEVIISTLHLYKDIFTEVKPFLWKIEENKEFDYTEIDFDGLIPE